MNVDTLPHAGVELETPLEEEVRKLIEKAWQEYPDEMGNTPLVETVAPDMLALPYFRFFRWMSTPRIKHILKNVDNLKIGSHGCLISTGYWDHGIGSGNDAVRAAQSDWDWAQKNLQIAEESFGIPANSGMGWKPKEFDTKQAREDATRMMSWNDSSMYDHEKKALVRLALEQELSYRKSFAQPLAS